MIDIHCHLLPGIDDGPPTLEAALALAKACADDGITHTVVTPHVFPGRYENWKSSIEAEFTRFVDVLKTSGIPLELMWAGEVRLTPEALDLLARNELPFVGRVENARTLLLEMPDGQVPLGAMLLVRRLIASRIRPIIVHPERNRGVMEQPDRLHDFVDAGCFVQLTAGSLVGQFGAKAQTTAVALLDRHWVHAIASDAHNLTGRRPRMREARDWLTRHYDEKLARQLTLLGPAGLSMQNSAVNLDAGLHRSTSGES